MADETTTRSLSPPPARRHAHFPALDRHFWPERRLSLRLLLSELRLPGRALLRLHRRIGDAESRPALRVHYRAYRGER